MATSYCKSIVCQLCHLQTELIILFDIYKGGHIMFLSFTWAPFVALSGPSYGSPCKKKEQLIWLIMYLLRAEAIVLYNIRLPKMKILETLRWKCNIEGPGSP